ncbi:MAG: DUF58 domain-containing protein [Thermoanaerobaculia bacterium]|nr:DUF58 domain-containing protein [Thermoanaerobaculia bacterium]
MTTISTPAPSFTFEGVVRLTRIGTSYVIFTIVIGFAALNTGNNALYIGLTFMLGSLLLSGVASKGGLKHLEVAAKETAEAWAGQPADIQLLIRNRSAIWNVRDVVIASHNLAEPVLISILRSREEVTVAVPMIFQKRGRVELSAIDLYTRYPFGLFLKKRRVRLRGELVVFPRLIDNEFDVRAFRPASGDQTAANRVGPGSEIHSLRDYVRGDSLRHVHWKKSASLGRWIMKQTDQEAAHTVHVVIDPYRPARSSDDEFERMISAATTFVRESLLRGFDVILQLPRLTLRSKDAQGGHSMFRALALLEAAHEPIDQVAEPESIVFSLDRRVS